MRRVIVLTLLPLVLVVSQAQASLLLIEPDLFPAGTDISDAFPGVTLWVISAFTGTVDRCISINPSEQQNPANASTGVLSFGHRLESPHLFRLFDPYTHNQSKVLRAAFDVPAVSVSVDFISNTSIDTGTLVALDIVGSEAVVLDTYTTSFLGLNQVETATVHATGGNIRLIMASGSDKGVVIDNMRVETVPEPSTLALWSLFGMFAVGYGRWKKRKTA
jgi:hypothetical protein